MALFSRKTKIAENRIENTGRWPLRLTRFQLIDDYDFSPINFPEIFFVEAGSFLHETAAGTQVLQEGSVIMANARQSHLVKQPTGAVFQRLRYLPEWFVREYEIIVRSPNLLGLFFDQTWFQIPREDHIHIFTARRKGNARVRAEFDYMRDIFREGHWRDPIGRVSLLKLMAVLVKEYQRFWRGAPILEIPTEVLHLLDRVEERILRGEPTELKNVVSKKQGREELDAAFQDCVGLGLEEYALRRRASHAAFLLVETTDRLNHISNLLGWPNTEEFDREFEIVFEIPPAAYREKFKNLGTPDSEADATDVSSGLEACHST